MKKLFPLLFFSILIGLGCKTNSRTVDPEQVQALANSLESNPLKIEFDFALPLVTTSMAQLGNAQLFPYGSNASRISLNGSNATMVISKDSVEAHLPYYGERQIVTTTNPSNAGIQFNGVPNNFKVNQNLDKGMVLVTFDINNATENFQIDLELFPNKRAMLHVFSTHRRRISYQGNIE
ncbi:hypothetical protein GCM10011414_13570 [Croceivirga lutea]|uniref:DUF4251 domain-containing protein n=1 Tax=Croceivirga lutea TaxID=1775167 RepID=UPI00163B20B5|nr:DUF4251 domain-containing protein [Croceivirga lutea]GGG45300.1 hypothetical protein GCM10011414_13570 [Croceivirga lutea]